MLRRELGGVRWSGISRLLARVAWRFVEQRPSGLFPVRVPQRLSPRLPRPQQWFSRCQGSHTLNLLYPYSSRAQRGCENVSGVEGASPDAGRGGPSSLFMLSKGKKRTLRNTAVPIGFSRTATGLRTDPGIQGPAHRSANPAPAAGRPTHRRPPRCRVGPRNCCLQSLAPRS